ncbi:polysaccharide deacetylase family protein [Desulfoluna sp.]|uniref:polysaccharide deacetylase family protein n=1 Tax=Desulfoluna sp. TaxID=2045199 RepID=UPI002609ECF9|nr:polysaccharide deacetylase family protein [Desulfoluna sp.]
MGFTMGEGRLGKCSALLMLMVMLWVFTPVCTWAGTDSAVIFMYHRFGDARFSSTNIRMDQFKAHLAYLEDNGFKVAPLNEVVAALKKGEELPDKTVVLTMDDAYASLYDNAWPLLKEKGWPFTVFVSTDVVDHHYKDYMTWDQLREISEGGAQVANHTASHPYMIKRFDEETQIQWLGRLQADILKAQGRLEEEIGTCPQLLAYPYGEYNTQVANMVSELGYTAFGQNSGAVGTFTDLRAIPRFPLSERYGDMKAFHMKANARALPVVSETPWNPQTLETRPELEITLAPTDALLDELSCYVSGQGRVEIQWVIPGKRFKVQARDALSVGRHKYNITVPGKDRSIYHWFSRQWIVR